jgi:hypothetical protein
VCGCDGITYTNACVAQTHHGVTSFTNGPCQNTCINSAQIQTGLTVDCISIYAPVCGCDGVEYANSCSAFYYGGVTSYTMGTCGESNCQLVPIEADFGECAMPLGYLKTPNGCVFKSGCSTTSNFGINYASYFFSSLADCNAACDSAFLPCVLPAQINTSQPCPNIANPVCGCDGITYMNACEATYYGGVTSFTPGSCNTNSISAIDVNNAFVLYPNPTNSIIHLNLIKQGMINIYNINGQLIFAENTFGRPQLSIDLSSYPKGIYRVELVSTYDNRSGKTIVVE